MKLLQPKWLSFSLLFVLLALAFSCTYTNTFPPKLNAKGDSVFTIIKKSNGFEDITLQEKTSNGTGENTTVLTARLYNGKNIPAETDTTALKKLGKDIATQIEAVVINPNTINGYVVLFCKRTTEGTVTHTEYNGYEYASDELKN